MDSKQVELLTYIDELEKVFTVGKSHLISDIAIEFSAADFLFFYEYRTNLWENYTSVQQYTFSIAFTELYLSALLHIYSSEFKFNFDSKNLELSILYSDLLSGAFSKKLLEENEADILFEWLNLLLKIHQKLVHFSLDGKNIYQKKEILLNNLISYFESKIATPSLNKIKEAALLLLLNKKSPNTELTKMLSILSEEISSINELRNLLKVSL